VLRFSADRYPFVQKKRRRGMATNPGASRPVVMLLTLGPLPSIFMQAAGR
jgi:hypothetical protein